MTRRKQPSAPRSTARNSPAREGVHDSTPGGRASGPAWQWIAGACGVLLLAIAILYRELIFGNQVFFAPDSMSAGSLAAAGKHLLEEGTYPLWNPYIFGGMPSFGSVSFLPYVYPVNFVLGILVRYLFFPEYTWLLFHTFLTGAGTFLLARDHGARFGVALSAGVLMMWMPNLVAIGANGHGSQACAVAYIPLALLFWDRLWRGRGLVVNATALALVLGLSMLRGHLQVSYYTYAVVGLHAFVFGVLRIADGARGRSTETSPLPPPIAARMSGAPPVGRAVADVAGAWIVLVAVVGVSVLMSAVLYLPVSDYAKHSIRGASLEGGLDYSYATMWSLHPSEMLTFLIPHSFGFGKDLYLGHMPFTDYPNYLGVLVVAFALVAVLAVRGRWVMFLVVTWVVATLVSFGSFFPVLYNPLFKLMPFFDKFRVPVMVLIVQQVATIALFAVGLNAVLAAEGTRLRRLALRALIAAGVIFAIAVLSQSYWTGGFVNSAATHVRATQDPSQRRMIAGLAGEFLGRDLFELSLILLLGALAVFAFARGRIKPWLLVGIVLVLAAADYYRVDRFILHPETFLKHDGYRILRSRGDTERFKSTDEMIEFLHAQAGPFRVLPLDGPQPAPAEGDPAPPISFQVQGLFATNRFMVFEIPSVGGYHPAKLQNYEEFISALRFSLEHGRLDLASMMNARYFVAGVRLPEGDALTPVWAGRDYDGQPRAIYENAESFPHAWIAGSYRVETSDEGLAVMANGEMDLRSTALLEAPPPIEPVPGDSASVNVVRLDPQEQVFDVELTRPGILVVSEVYYPDWKVRVDGAPARLLRANHVLRAVALPTGRHEVSFHYDASLVKEAATISITTFALVLLVLGGAAVVHWKGMRWKRSS